MAIVNEKDYTKSRPVLQASEFPKGDVVPFTIAKVEHVDFDANDGTGKQKRIVLQSKEHGEKVLWLNITSIRALIARIGNDDARWVGVTVPLVKVRTTNPSNGAPMVALWVAPNDDDDSWGLVSAKSSKPKAAKKRGR